MWHFQQNVSFTFPSIFTVNVTSNLQKSGKFWGIPLWILVNYRAVSCRTSALCLQNVHALSPERPCSVCRTFVLCPENVRALSVKRPCSVHKTFVLCLENVRALFAERPCSVRRTSVLCSCISELSAAYPQSDWLAKSSIVVAKKSIISQVANRSCREEES